MGPDWTKGMQAVYVLFYLLFFSGGYWLMAWLLQDHLASGGPWLKRYVFYHEFLLIGVLFGLQFRPPKKFNSRATWLQAHQAAAQELAWALGALVIVLVIVQDVAISRVFLLSLVPALYLILTACNYWIPSWIFHWFGASVKDQVLLVGSGTKVAPIIEWFRHNVPGVQLQGWLSTEPRESVDEVLPIPRCGAVEELEDCIKRFSISQVILGGVISQASLLAPVTQICERYGARLLVVSDLEDCFAHSVTYFHQDGIYFIGLRREPLESPLNQLLKRVFDIAVALPIVLTVLPVMTVFVWLFQRWQSPGPIFYPQERSGAGNQAFLMYKFRTMHVHTVDPSRQARPDDDRIYPAGRWLRRSSLDELPQFWNVLLGNMSVVGPRPHLPVHNQAFARAMNNYQVRSRVKPGITGLAQIRGYRGAVADQADVVRRVKADIDYLENWNLFRDLVIVLRTILQVLVPPRSAY